MMELLPTLAFERSASSSMSTAIDSVLLDRRDHFLEAFIGHNVPVSYQFSFCFRRFCTGVGWTRLDSTQLGPSSRIVPPISYPRRLSARRHLFAFLFISTSNRRRSRRLQPSSGPSLLGVLGQVAISSRAIVSTSAFGREQGRLLESFLGFAWVPKEACRGELDHRI